MSSDGDGNGTASLKSSSSKKSFNFRSPLFVFEFEEPPDPMPFKSCKRQVPSSDPLTTISSDALTATETMASECPNFCSLGSTGNPKPFGVLTISQTPTEASAPPETKYPYFMFDLFTFGANTRCCTADMLPPENVCPPSVAKSNLHGFDGCGSKSIAKHSTMSLWPFEQAISPHNSSPAYARIVPSQKPDTTATRPPSRVVTPFALSGISPSNDRSPFVRIRAPPIICSRTFASLAIDLHGWSFVLLFAELIGSKETLAFWSWKSKSSLWPSRTTLAVQILRFEETATSLSRS